MSTPATAPTTAARTGPRASPDPSRSRSRSWLTRPPWTRRLRLRLRFGLRFRFRFRLRLRCGLRLVFCAGGGGPAGGDATGGSTAGSAGRTGSSGGAGCGTAGAGAGVDGSGSRSTGGGMRPSVHPQVRTAHSAASRCSALFCSSWRIRFSISVCRRSGRAVAWSRAGTPSRSAMLRRLTPRTDPGTVSASMARTRRGSSRISDPLRSTISASCIRTRACSPSGPPDVSLMSLSVALWSHASDGRRDRCKFTSSPAAIAPCSPVHDT